MCGKVLINETVLDKLLEKALPEEYEVLVRNDSLITDEEEQYYLIIVGLLAKYIKICDDWLKSDEIRHLLDVLSVIDLDYDFFDEIERQFREEFKVDFNNAFLVLGSIYSIGKLRASNELNVDLIDFTTDSLALDIIKHHNYQLVTNLMNDLGKNLKDVLWNGIKDGLDVHEISAKLVEAGLSPVGKFTPETRAEMIVRTEYSRVLNTAKLQTYQNYGVKLVDIVTQHDSKVCSICIENEMNNPYTITEAMGLIPSHTNCYMPDTQVFTNNGWKYFYDLNNNDEILSLNPETKETEFISEYNLIKHKNNYDYMVRIYNKWFDTCITPDHDCFIYQRKQINGKRQLISEFRKPSELNSESKFYRICENNNKSPEYIDINGLKFRTEDYVFLMAWYISEGSVLHNPKLAKLKNYPIKITQLKKDTRKLIEPIFKKISDYLDIKLYISESYFEFHSKELYDYLLPLGYSYEKYIPKEIFSLNKEHINLFLDNYVLGDGTLRKKDNKYFKNSISKSIFTSSKNLVNDLSYLILLSGHYPSISLTSKKGTIVKHKNGEYVQNHDCYKLSINNSEYSKFDRCNVEYIDYSDDVFCVELPKYHTLWTKRNGKTTWNGNCRCFFMPHLEEELFIDDFVDINEVIIDLTNY